MALLSWVNGQQNQDVISTDRGLAFGDGLFETMRVKDAQIFWLKLHWERLSLGCKVLAFHFSYDDFMQALKPALQQTKLQPNDVFKLKLILTRGASTTGYSAPLLLKHNVIILLSSLSASVNKLRQEGVKLISCQWPLADSPQLAGIKHLNRLDQVMAKQECQHSQCFDGLMYNQAGELIESTSANLFLVKEGAVFTPCIKNAGVKGVMRRGVMEQLAPMQQLQIKEQVFTDLEGLTEIFITNAIIGIVPVTAVDDRKYPIGVIAQKLQQALFQCESTIWPKNSLS